MWGQSVSRRMAMDIKQIVLDLCALNDEQEWFEFKEN